MAIHGVDISTHNGDVNFSLLKSAGIKYVIIRCGYGSDYTSQDDDWYSANVRKAEETGMPWGVYLYSYAKTPEMARSEAQHVLRLLGGRIPPYGVWYDVEDAQIASYDLVSTCDAFCQAIQAAGLYVGIYATLSWLETKLNSSRLDKYDKWVAQWNSTCDYMKPYGMWQYTESLIIGGKAFDGNYAYKDYPALTGNKKEEDEMTADEVRKIVKEEINTLFDEAAKEGIPAWAKAAMEWAVFNGVLKGDKDGNLRPESYVKRDEAAQMFYNFSGEGKEPSEYAKEIWEKAVEMGIIDGSNPKAAMTREQGMVFFDRLGLLTPKENI